MVPLDKEVDQETVDLFSKVILYRCELLKDREQPRDHAQLDSDRRAEGDFLEETEDFAAQEPAF